MFSQGALELLEHPTPPGYADFWTENVAAHPRSKEATLSVVLFRLADEWLGLDTALLKEIASMREVHPIPHRAHTLLQGLVNIRGKLHLCIGLHGLLEIPPPKEQRTSRLVVLEKDGETWVFEADEVFGVERIAMSTLSAAPATLPASLAAVTRGIFPWRDERVGYLDGAPLIASFSRALS